MRKRLKSALKAVNGINKLNAVIDWELFREELQPILGYDNRGPKRGGRPPFDALRMLKVLVLQKYYGLSDEEVATNKLRSRIRVRCEYVFRQKSPEETSNHFFLWLILAHTMQRAAFVDDVGAVEADNLAVREALADNLQCLRIQLRLPVGRHKHGPVEHKIVEVAGGEWLAVLVDQQGHW